MSIVVETFIMCDSHASKECYENFGVDNRNAKADAQRKDAKNNGWKFDGKNDICPACQLAIKLQSPTNKNP